MSAIEHRAVPVEPAKTDWFSMACELLAPSTRHHATSMVALDWDAFDRLDGHGWEYQAWTVDPSTQKKVPDGTTGELHEQRSRKLLDGSTVTCFPPSSGDRPALMLCPNCDGHGQRDETDENGEPVQLQCRDCHGNGTMPRPFAPLPDGMVMEDFIGPEPAEPQEAPF